MNLTDTIQILRELHALAKELIEEQGKADDASIRSALVLMDSADLKALETGIDWLKGMYQMRRILGREDQI